MISFLKKPADKFELLAAIEYFKPINLTVFLFEGNNRISEKEVEGVSKRLESYRTSTGAETDC